VLSGRLSNGLLAGAIHEPYYTKFGPAGSWGLTSPMDGGRPCFNCGVWWVETGGRCLIIYLFVRCEGFDAIDAQQVIKPMDIVNV
jgi:hypothetical protein